MITEITTDLKDFIGVYTNVYPEGYCQHLIAEFDRLQESGISRTRKENENALKHDKDDTQIFMNMKPADLNWFDNNTSQQIFFKGLQSCFEHYADQYSILRTSNLRCTAMKAQKTSSGGGYHIWHTEQNEGDQASRALVYMLYLNTLPTESCGETEFLYQQRRIRPTENTMIVWPASFTHAHRGNPVYGDVAKYIVTGWFYYD
jgi:hypothetical protein